MIDYLLQLDHSLFFLINNDWANPVFDWIMPLLRNRFFWTPVYMFLIAFFLINYKRKGLWLILFLLATFFITDFTSSSIVKPLFQRLRPCNDVSISSSVRLLIDCGSGYSFTSSHSANHFGISFFLIIIFYRKAKWVLPVCLIWAASVAFAQVYVGVHFPLDVFFGAILGALTGFYTGTIARKYNPEL